MVFFAQQTRDDFEAAGLGRLNFFRFIKAFLLYPQFTTVWRWRRAMQAFAKSRFLARYYTAQNQRQSGNFLSPCARVGTRLRLPHPTGIVVGEHAVIGDDVTIYQHVTIGQRGVLEEMPVIKNGVVIYAGACVLGGITVGENAVIGANAVVIDDVPDGAVVVGAPARSVKQEPCLSKTA